MKAVDELVLESTEKRVSVFYTGADGELHREHGRLRLMDETGLLLLKSDGILTYFLPERIVKIERNVHDRDPSHG